MTNSRFAMEVVPHVIAVWSSLGVLHLHRCFVGEKGM
jgi:hypothetical protein